MCSSSSMYEQLCTLLRSMKRYHRQRSPRFYRESTHTFNKMQEISSRHFYSTWWLQYRCQEAPMMKPMAPGCAHITNKGYAIVVLWRKAQNLSKPCTTTVLHYCTCVYPCCARLKLTSKYGAVHCTVLY